MRAWMVSPHSAVVIRGTPGATRNNDFVRAWAVPPHSLGGGYQGDGLVLEEVSIGMEWHADEQR